MDWLRKLVDRLKGPAPQAPPPAQTLNLNPGPQEDNRFVPGPQGFAPLNADVGNFQGGGGIQDSTERFAPYPQGVMRVQPSTMQPQQGGLLRRLLGL